MRAEALGAMQPETGDTLWRLHVDVAARIADALIPRMDAEGDPAARRALMIEAHRLHNAEMGHVPLYHMMIPWAHRQGVAIRHRADNQFQVREIKVD